MYLVFTKSGCSACLNVKKLLKENNISFKEIDTDTSDGWELANSFGVQALGEVYLDSGEKVDLQNLIK